MSNLHLPLLLALASTSQNIALALSLSSTVPPPFGVNARLAAKPERLDELTALLHQNRAATLQNEPQALQFTFGPDADDPSVFHLHERFASQDGFHSHRNAPHLHDWREFRASDPFLTPPLFELYDLAEGSGAALVPDDGETGGLFCLNVDIRIRPEVRGEFLEVIRGNALGSNRDEELCLQYAWGEDVEVANLFHFHEEYAGGDGGKEGFDAHASAPHFKEWERFAGDGGPFMEPPVVKFFTTL